MSHLKKEMQVAMNAAVAEAKSCIGDWEKQKLGDLAEIVAGKRHRGDSLDLFRYEDRAQNCPFTHLLGVHWQANFPQLSTDTAICSHSDNPLLYSDVDSYVSAMSQLKAETALSELQAEYYKAHFDCFQSKEKAFLASLQDSNIADGMEKWTQRGLDRLQSTLKWTVPELIRKDLARRLDCAYVTLSETAESHRIIEEFKAKSSVFVTEPVEFPTTERKRRGRPPKRGSFSRDLEPPRKHKKQIFLVEMHSQPFETVIPWEGLAEFTEKSSPDDVQSL